MYNTFFPKLVYQKLLHSYNTHINVLTHTSMMYSPTGPKRCLNYETCGPWRIYTVVPDDKEWDRVIAFLNEEGRNEEQRWNDYCGCYDQR